jgi:hypothetical protein
LPNIDLSAYTPHAGQIPFHASEARFKVVETARRFGKSRQALYEMLRRYAEDLSIPADPSLVPPWHGWIVVPSFPQARQTWNELLTLIPPTGLATPDQFHQNEMMVYLAGSEQRSWGFIEIKSGHDPENLQSVGLDFLWVNESQDISDRAFEKMLPTLRTPGRMSRAVYEGIPSMHADHWFRKMYVMAERGERPEYEAFKNTAFENPMLSKEQLEEIESDREVLTDAAWRRLYLAEFSASAGYFANIDACTAGDLLPSPIPGARYVAGLDLGRKVDASVLHIFDTLERKLVFHRSWDAGESWIIQREAITHICREWTVERLIMDATGMGGDIFSQELADMGLPVEPFIINQQSREHLLNTTAVSLERQTVSFPPVGSLLRQLRAFQYRKTAGGNYRAEAPPGEHDDEVFALGLGLEACEPAQDVQIVRGSGSRKYLPTQAEAGTRQFNSKGAKYMKQRQIDRARERQDRIGVS